ncbi:MAG: hypothetical protein PVJ63_05805 [Thioalkalispiraceae bacterium]|jgi:hypothetical protein
MEIQIFFSTDDPLAGLRICFRYPEHIQQGPEKPCDGSMTEKLTLFNARFWLRQPPGRHCVTGITKQHDSGP